MGPEQGLAMMRVALTILFVAALAGCSADTQTTQAVSCQAEHCQATVEIETEAPATVTIKGVVVDETVTPVPDAQIRILAANSELARVDSDSSGAFAFHGLADGFYILLITKEGYAKAETQLDIQGPPAKAIRIQILGTPPIIPTHTLLQWDGLLGCSVRWTLGSSQFCSLVTIATGDETYDDSRRTFYDEVVSPGIHPDWVQAEMVWESNQAAGEALSLHTWSDGRTPSYSKRLGIVEGPSPLAFAMDRATIEENGIGRASNASMPQGFYFQVWAGSAGPLTPSVTCQQDFTFFLSLIYHQTPPEGWMFVTDGGL